jgi:2-pyrone-4,6-dicarboxylate lactonase
MRSDRRISFPMSRSAATRRPAAPIEHYFGLARVLGLTRGVMVQPQVHRFDYASTLDAIAKGEGRLLGMVHANADLTEGDHRKLHAGGVRGVRFNFVGRTGGTFDPAWLNGVVASVETLGWPVDLHVEAEFLNHHADLIRRIPLPVVLDHFASLRSITGADAPRLKVLCDLLGEGPHRSAPAPTPPRSRRPRAAAS